MDELNKVLIQKITELASKNSFIHHKWYIKHHILVIEKIAMELCDLYPEVDRDLITTLVWVHDLAKINGFEQEDFEKSVTDLLTEIGFKEEYITKVIETVGLFERKMEIDLSLESIEVKILASADGAAHMVGPFNSIYLYENPDKEIEDLLQGNINKMNKDWERKIVLPEVKKAFEDRRKFSLENNGQLPDKILS